MLKNLILVIVGGVVIGLGIFFGGQIIKGESKSNVVRHRSDFSTNNLQPETTSTPKPTFEPLNESTDLVEEINNLTPPDFSEDFQNLKNQISQ